MKFHNYRSYSDGLKIKGKSVNVDETHERVFNLLTKNGRIPIERLSDDDITTLSVSILQRKWFHQVRPYYKVWPAVHDSLLRVPLDIPVRAASLSLNQTFAIRLQVGSEISFGTGYSVQSLLVDVCDVLVGIVIQVAEMKRDGLHAVDYGPITFNPNDDHTFEHVIDTRTYDRWPATVVEHFRTAVRLAVGVLLMSKDPSIITADVLAKDRRKYEETGDTKYIEKARKRGIVGWSIGEKYESCPHIRRPHFAIRHTGKGGKIPRIVPIKGAVVHTKKLTTVPTGYITPNGVEVEPQSQ